MAHSRRQLIILQQSPFCNINCKYCYLPNRLNKDRISFETLEKIYHSLFQSTFIRDPIRILWHAGEPLAVGHDFMAQAFLLSQHVNRYYGRTVSHNIQTNATLIDRHWITIFQEHRVNIGLSIDGPAFIHDQQRVTRGNKGTHDRVMRSVRLLQQAGIPFDIIMVLTYVALDYPDEIFDFLLDNQIRGVAFNIDEIEGIHRTSSYDQADSIKKYREFMRRFLSRVWSNPGKVRFRELYSMVPSMLDARVSQSRGERFNNTNVPLQILTFDYNGNYNTFCPELSGARNSSYNNFIMGNIYTDPIDYIFQNHVFQSVNAEIQRGVDLCQATCAYWDVCGGGSPANKYFEAGRFDIAETRHCTVHIKALADTLTEFLAERLHITMEGDYESPARH